MDDKSMMNSVPFTDHSNLNLNRFFNDIRRYKPLSSSDELQYIRAAQTGDKEALGMLVKHNAAFLVSIAKQMCTPYVDINDMIDSGCEGLIKAIHRFNTAYSFRLVSFAKPYIYKAMMGHLMQDKPVYIPDNQMRILRQTDEEMYDVIRLDDEETMENWEYDIINYHNADENLDEWKDEVQKYLNRLPNKYADMFRMSYGLDDGFEHATETVAFVHRCSRERVRQIKKQVLCQLKNHFNGSNVA